jgi:hypothetical protein
VLCDDHDPDVIAYRIVWPDLSGQDLSYGESRLESKSLLQRCARWSSDPTIAWRR